MRFLSFLFLFFFFFSSAFSSETKHHHWLEGKKKQSLSKLIARKKANRGLSYEIINDRFPEEYLSSSVRTLKIRLSNGLEAFLISDPEVKQSGASLVVKTGSWQDPAEFPGMAHFLEHLLFMGTKAYPNENDYQEYILDNGGTFNAMTFHDRTVFAFSVPPFGFEGALDRFSHFFIDPLLRPSCIEREINAIEHEFGDSIEEDFLRMWRVFKETGNSKHPNAVFSIGNKESLAQVTEKDMRKWFERHYVPQNMKLLVISPLSLEKLQEAVISRFSAIQARPFTPSVFPFGIFSEKQRGHVIHLSSTVQNRVLLVSWELPLEVAQHPEKKAAKLAMLALDHSGDNSLKKLLKKQKLADDVFFDIISLDHNHQLFIIGADLTSKGLQEVDSVIDCFFQSLAFLKEQDIPRSLFEQYQKYQQQKLYYHTPHDVFSFLIRRGVDLADEEIATFPLKKFQVDDFDSRSFKECIHHFTPESAIYCLITDLQEAHVVPNSIEKWMKTDYLIRPFPKEKLKRWSELTPHPEIGFSNACSGLFESLLEDQDEEEENEEDDTELITLQEDSFAHIEFAKSQESKESEMGFFFSYQTPLFDEALKNQILASLYIQILNNQLDILNFQSCFDYFFFFEGSELNGMIEGKGKDFFIQATFIFQQLKKLICSKEDFEFEKEQLTKMYLKSTSPLSFALNTLDSILENVQADQDRKKILETISYEDFLLFSNSLFNVGFLEGVLAGNCTQDEAMSFWSSCQETLTFSSYAHQEQLPPVFTFPLSPGPLMVVEHFPYRGSAALLLLEIDVLNDVSFAAHQIILTVLKSAFFDELRTKQQVAYSSYVDAMQHDDRLFQIFGVQSSTHHPEDILERFEAFLDQFICHFEEKITPVRFELLQKSVRHVLKEENGVEIAEAFERGIQQLSYSQFLEKVKLFFHKDNHKRLAILIKGRLENPNNQPSCLNYSLISRKELSSWKILN